MRDSCRPRCLFDASVDPPSAPSFPPGPGSLVLFGMGGSISSSTSFPISSVSYPGISAGQVLIAFIQSADNSGSTLSITDTAGNAWTTVFANQNYGLWYAVANSTNHTTVTFHGSGPSGGAEFWLTAVPNVMTVTSAVSSGTGTSAMGTIDVLSPSFNLGPTSVNWVLSLLKLTRNSQSTVFLGLVGTTSEQLGAAGVTAHWTTINGSGISNRFTQLWEYTGP